VSDNTFLNRLVRTRHGNKAEVRAAKRLGGRAQPGSGSQDHSKGDIKGTSFLVESKATIHDSLSLKAAYLKKISTEALEISREAALIVQFVDGQGKVIPGYSWVMIEERVFRELVPTL
jgi:hypothetical protein